MPTVEPANPFDQLGRRIAAAALAGRLGITPEEALRRFGREIPGTADWSRLTEIVDRLAAKEPAA